MTSSNEFNISLEVANLNEGDSFRGGLFTDLDGDFSSLIENATSHNCVLGDGNGSEATFDMQDYYSLTTTTSRSGPSCLWTSPRRR